EQRQIDVALDIALRTGIAIPIPGAAEVPALLDNADVLHTRFAQTRGRELPAEAAADDERVDVILQWRARKTRLDIVVVDVVLKIADRFDVLRIGIGAQTAVALRAILGEQDSRIEAKLFRRIEDGAHIMSPMAWCRKETAFARRNQRSIRLTLLQARACRLH